MRKRRGRHYHSFLVACLVVALLVPGRADAFHEGDERIIDRTAYLLRDGEWVFGMWDVGWGAWSWLTLDSYTLPWLVGAANFSAKFRLWTSGPWAFSGKIGLVALDIQKFKKRFLGDDIPPSSVVIVPIELMASWRLSGMFTASAGILSSPIVAKGESEEDDVQGAAGSSNVQALLSLEMRLGRKWAFLLCSRHLLYMDVTAKAKSERTIDEYTTLEIVGSAGSEGVAGLEFPSVFSVVPAVAYSRESFNMFFGLGYGNWSLPVINFVRPTKSPVVEFDMFWRW